MYKILATCAAVAVTALIALPGPVSAAERRADGIQNSDQLEVSSQRRYRRHASPRRYHGQRSYGRSYYAPQYGYAPRSNYGYAPRPYYRPAPFPFFFGG